MRKKIVVTGGIVTSILFATTGSAFAQTTSTPPASGVYRIRNENSGPLLDEIATEFGLNVAEIQEELKSGKTPKQILSDQGISSAQIQKLFKNKTLPTGSKGIRASMAPEMIQAEAGALGIGIDQLKADLQAGKKPRQIAQDEGMTVAQYQQNLISQLQQMIQVGAIAQNKVNQYTKLIQKISQNIQ